MALKMEHAINSAVDSGQIAGAVLIAQDVKGSIDIHRSYGVKTLKHSPQANPPITEDTVLRMASCTKLLTSVMALQCVERGLLDLDSPAEHLTPEIGEMKVLTGYDAAGNPQLESPKVKITLRNLLDHSSGICYAAMIPTLISWATSHGVPLDASGPRIQDNFFHPLAFQPATDWGYGPGPDWAGRIIEKVTNANLDDFMRKNICDPLGAKDITFYLQRRPDMLARRGDMAVRDTETGPAKYEDRKFFHEDPIDCMGGMGAFMTPRDFMKVLNSLLLNDGKLLKPATRDVLFQPSLNAACEKGLNDKGIQIAEWKPHGLLGADVKKSHALGGVLVLENVKESGRRSGSISWSGLPNHFWTLDPHAGVCILSAFHLEPWGDAKCFELGQAFENEV